MITPIRSGSTHVDTFWIYRNEIKLNLPPPVPGAYPHLYFITPNDSKIKQTELNKELKYLLAVSFTNDCFMFSVFRFPYR